MEGKVLSYSPVGTAAKEWKDCQEREKRDGEERRREFSEKSQNTPGSGIKVEEEAWETELLTVAEVSHLLFLFPPPHFCC